MKQRLTKTHKPRRDAPEPSRKPLGGERISSLAPHTVAALLAAMGIAWLAVTAHQAEMSWVAFAVAVGHLGASATILAAWKQVRRGKLHYFVSNVFKSETVGFEDVCAVVDSPGVCWKTTRIHFRRRTRFGWAISYVPAKETERTTAVAKHPERQLI